MDLDQLVSENTPQEGDGFQLDVSEEDGFVIVQPSEEQTPTE